MSDKLLTFSFLVNFVVLHASCDVVKKAKSEDPDEEPSLQGSTTSGSGSSVSGVGTLPCENNQESKKRVSEGAQLTESIVPSASEGGVTVDDLPDPAPDASYFTFTGCVDGSDYLIVKDGVLIIEHRNYIEIGKHQDCQGDFFDPVGKFFVNKSSHSLPDSGSGIAVPFVRIGSFEVTHGRGEVSMEADGRILIDDDSHGGAAVYQIRVKFEGPGYTSSAATLPDSAGDGSYFTFTACVDGSDFLIVKDGVLTLDHRNSIEMGVHDDCKGDFFDPSGKFFVDKFSHSLADSSCGIAVPVSSIGSFEVTQGRGEVSLEADGRILINDDSHGGAAVYQIRVKFEGPGYTNSPATLPDPAGDGSYFTFTACVDGSDYLVINTGKLTIQHRSFMNVGTHDSCNSEFLNPAGKFYIDKSPYTLPDIGEGISVPFNAVGSVVTLSGRGNISIGGDGRILIDDDGWGGPDVYQIRVHSP